jgi:hypothetical protein
VSSYGEDARPAPVVGEAAFPSFPGVPGFAVFTVLLITGPDRARRRTSGASLVEGESGLHHSIG